MPVAALTRRTRWVPVLPATTHRPSSVTATSVGPTTRRSPTQPLKSLRRLVGVKEVTKAGGVISDDSPGSLQIVVTGL
jgi:hypothetical protein